MPGGEGLRIIDLATGRQVAEAACGYLDGAVFDSSGAALYTIGTNIYQQQGGGSSDGGPTPGDGGAGPTSGGDDVIDAEFSESENK